MRPAKDTQKITRRFAFPFIVFFSILMFPSVLTNIQTPIQNLFFNDSQMVTRGISLPTSPRFGIHPFASRPTSTVYDEQLGISFTQNFASLTYTVSAVAQTGTDGYGPAYLLNGVGNTGYWYQVGLAYDWDANPASGFQLAYEVFNSTGAAVFPVNGGGGIATFSPVNPGDAVQLSLSFSNGNVVMQATDQNTGARSQQTYTAAGATYFAGTPSSQSNSQGFFTGLMTEWYHTAPYYGGEQKVTYNDNGTAITSAWLWIDEFSVSASGIGSRLFSDSTSSPVTFTNPSQFQSFTSNGAIEAANATQFITGQISTVALSFGYSVKGGTSFPPAPILTYIFAGVQQKATLTQSDQTFLVDTGTSWSVTNPLSSSTLTERWQTNQASTGVATSPQTIDFVFFHQYLVTFSFDVVGGGANYSPPTVTCQEFGNQITPTMGTPIWADAAQYSLPNLLTGSSSSERWAANSSSGTVSSSGSITVEYFHQYLNTVSYSVIGGGTPGAPTLTATAFGAPLYQTLTIQPQAFWIDSSALYSLTNPLPDSTASERWQTNVPTAGNVVSSTTSNIPYAHQYYVTINLNPTAGGSVPAVSGWYDAGASFQSEATSNPGWQFESWSGTGQGAYSGNNSDAVANIDSPLTETAIFYPGLTITASGKVSVSYTYNAEAGLIPPSSQKTIYEPSGAEIQLNAKPTLFIYSFSGWTGSTTSNKRSIAIVLDTPQNITANFSYNYAVVGIAAAAVIAVIAAAIIWAAYRRKKPPINVSH